MVLALREPQPMLEMNMTPLIDVLLVLIIMFIITVQIQTNAVKIDLPGKPPPVVLTPNPVRNLLTIAPDGIARWNGIAASDATLMATLRATVRCGPSPSFTSGPTDERGTSGSMRCWR